MTRMESGARAASAVLGTLCLTVLPSRVAAQTPDTLHACYVPASGTVYRIREPGLSSTCLGTSHVLFNWAAGGQPGATGPTGPQGSTGLAGPAGSAGATGPQGA